MDEFKTMTKYSSIQLYPKLYGDRAEHALEILKEFMISEHLKFFEPMEGAQDLLDTLYKGGIPMGLVSNKRHLFVTREIDHAGWTHYFKAIVGAGVAENDKPSADPLLHALDQAGLKPGRHVLFVGDTVSDLECAANAGCDCAFLYHAHPENPLIAQYKPALAVKDCPALLQELTI
jgi:phosphoglycolate phosphatase